MDYIYTKTGTKAKLRPDYSYLVEGLQHLIKGKHYIIRYASEKSLHAAVEDGSLSECVFVLPAIRPTVPAKFFN